MSLLVDQPRAMEFNYDLLRAMKFFSDSSQ